MTRIKIPWISVAILAAGCGAPPSKPPARTEPPEHSDKFSVAVIVESGAERNLDGIESALYEAAEKLGAQTRTQTVSKAELPKSLVSTIEENPDLTIFIGSELTDDVRSAIIQNPERKVAVLDYPSFSPNVLGITFKLEQGAFLAGLMAASTSKTGKLGLIVHSNDPNARRIETGFRAGVRTVSAKTAGAILVRKTEDAASAAHHIFQSGVDLVFCGSPTLARETIAAASAKGRYVIALGETQEAGDTGALLATIVKDGEKAILEAIRMAKESTFRGRTLELGIKDGYLAITEPSEPKKKVIPRNALDAIEEAKKMILDGALFVPKTDLELARFKPPRLAAFF